MLELNKIYYGDCLELIKQLPDNSIDAICTDPPYELGFMGKGWDSTGIANSVELWKECLRVLKPGGHLLAFSGTRTYHRMACAIDDAGFEIRDMLEWIYASGFPKSQNIEKMMEKKGLDGSDWKGLGTALKPAHEPICFARKPLSEKTIVENVMKWGTGGIDIDGCRIPTSEKLQQLDGSFTFQSGLGANEKGKKITFVDSGLGRFPANILCIDDALNDGVMTKSIPHNHNHKKDTMVYGGEKGLGIREGMSQFSDSGSKSRYFDIDVRAEKYGILQLHKASKKDRGEGNIHPTVKPIHLMSWLIRLISKPGDIVLEPFAGSGTTCVAAKMLGRNFIACELTEEYIPICEARINATEVIEEKPKAQTLFD